MEDYPFIRNIVQFLQIFCSAWAEDLGINTVQNDTMAIVSKNRGAFGTFHQPRRNRYDAQVGIKSGKSTLHSEKTRMCAIKQQAFTCRILSWTPATAALPAFTVKGMGTVGCIHEFRMQRYDSRDLMLLQPGNQSVNIYEIAVDALQMHHIRLFF